MELAAEMKISKIFGLLKRQGRGPVSRGDMHDEAAYDAWFRKKVQQARDDPRPGIPHEEVEEYFAKRRAKLSNPDSGLDSSDEQPSDK